jgi:chorismate synthase
VPRALDTIDTSTGEPAKAINQRHDPCRGHRGGVAASVPGTITVCANYSFDFIAPQLLPFGPLNLTRQVTVPMI